MSLLSNRLCFNGILSREVKTEAAAAAAAQFLCWFLWYFPSPEFLSQLDLQEVDVTKKLPTPKLNSQLLTEWVDKATDKLLEQVKVSTQTLPLFTLQPLSHTLFFHYGSLINDK